MSRMRMILEAREGALVTGLSRKMNSFLPRDLYHLYLHLEFCWRSPIWDVGWTGLTSFMIDRQNEVTLARIAMSALGGIQFPYTRYFTVFFAQQVCL